MVQGLNKSRLPYAITGALAASYYGNPRTTADADFVVQITPRNLQTLLNLLDNMGLKVDRTRIRKRLEAGYNIITAPDKHSSYRADFIVQTKGQLERRPGYLSGTRTFYHAPEALILAKLRMVKATRPKDRSHKDREDIKAIIRNTKVDKRKIVRLARRGTTLATYQEIISTN